MGRVRRNRKFPKSEADRLNERHGAVTVGAAMEVEELVLFESQLTPTGAVYSRLATVPLTDE